uniref:Nuclear autoantigenic sperm protein n=1 Tax=Penaeus vannamei TaxID=6689 RepID=A0A0U2L8E9_PENVA|nr:nuclear autoantigenic sperm protein [Penaeus vannamei]
MSESPVKAAETSASPKSSPSKKEIDTATQALNHFAQGKRHLVVGDISSAVNSLQEACRLLAEQYGETAPECGDAYFYYGRALLEMARMENGVLGNALDGVPDGVDMDNSQVENPEKMTEDEKNEVTEQVGKALEENFKDLEDVSKSKSAKQNGDAKGQAFESSGAEEAKMDVDSAGVSESKGEDGGEKKEKVKSDGEEKSKPETSDTDGTATSKVEASSVDSENVDEESKPEKKEVDTKDGSKDEAKESEVVMEEKVEADEEEGKATEKGEGEKQKVSGETKDEKGKEDAKIEEKVESEAKEEEMETDGAEKKEGSTEGEEEEEGDAEGEGEGEGEESQEESQDEGEKEEGASQEEGEKTEEDEEEVSNLQLSWEMLELAKVIYQKQQDDNPEMAKKVAQVYLKLGEVGLESENYSQGIEDFKQCLQIQEKILEEDNRCLAETHYQLGVAHSFSDDFDKAIESFTAAMKVIEMRIANLEKRIKEKKEWTEEQRKKDAAERPDPFYTEEGEIEELNKLLPEMKEKVTDMEEMKKDSKDRLQKAAKEAFMANAIGGTSKAGSSSQTGFDAPSSSTSVVPTEIKASNITHLVRKKRKPEDEVEGEEVKKAKGENGEAHGTANGTTNGTNGHTETMETEEKDTPSNGASTEELKEKAAEEMKKTTDLITGKTEAAS